MSSPTISRRVSGRCHGRRVKGSGNGAAASDFDTHLAKNNPIGQIQVKVLGRGYGISLDRRGKGTGQKALKESE